MEHSLWKWNTRCPATWKLKRFSGNSRARIRALLRILRKLQCFGPFIHGSGNIRCIAGIGLCLRRNSKCIEILFFAGNPALMHGGQTVLINDTLYWRKAGEAHAGCS